MSNINITKAVASGWRLLLGGVEVFLFCWLTREDLENKKGDIFLLAQESGIDEYLSALEHFHSMTPRGGVSVVFVEMTPRKRPKAMILP
jgi:hypothetical protein